MSHGEFFFYHSEASPRFSKLLQISLNYVPINEQASNFAVNTLQNQKLPRVSCQHFIDNVFEDNMFFSLLFN